MCVCTRILVNVFARRSPDQLFNIDVNLFSDRLTNICDVNITKWSVLFVAKWHVYRSINPEYQNILQLVKSWFQICVFLFSFMMRILFPIEIDLPAFHWFSIVSKKTTKIVMDNWTLKRKLLINHSKAFRFYTKFMSKYWCKSLQTQERICNEHREREK